jgi:hypothetical protein
MRQVGVVTSSGSVVTSTGGDERHVEMRQVGVVTPSGSVVTPTGGDERHVEMRHVGVIQREDPSSRRQEASRHVEGRHATSVVPLAPLSYGTGFFSRWRTEQRFLGGHGVATPSSDASSRVPSATSSGLSIHDGISPCVR